MPLDQILTSQKDLLALQHVLQREAAAAYSRLQSIVHSSAGAPATEAAMQESFAVPDYKGKAKAVAPHVWYITRKL